MHASTVGVVVYTNISELCPRPSSMHVFMHTMIIHSDIFEFVNFCSAKQKFLHNSISLVWSRHYYSKCNELKQAEQ